MSWIVQTLLLSRVNIRSEADINSDTFNDLIVLESKLDEMSDECLFTKDEEVIIDLLKEGMRISDIANIMGKHRNTVFEMFVELCERIAYLLGGEFTNDGYFEMMQDKYNLTNNQVATMKEYISGTFKHKVLKNPLQKRLNNNE